MAASPWSEAVARAVATLDPRDPKILIGFDEALHASSLRGRVEPSIWGDFPFPVVVVPEGRELPAALADATREGPVLTEIGFVRRGSSAVEARTQESLTAKLLSNGAAVARSGVLATLMPASLATSTSGGRVREILARGLALRQVIFGRGVLERVHSQFEVACLIWSLDVSDAGDVCFFRLPSGTYSSQELAVEHASLLSRERASGRFGYWAPVDLLQGESLAFDLRNPELQARRQQLAKLGRPTRVDALFDVLRPTPPPGSPTSSRNAAMHGDEDSPRGRDRYCDASVEGAVREVGGRDITPDGVRAAGDDSRYRLPQERDIFLAPGDLIVRSMIPPAPATGTCLMVATYDGPMDRAVAGTSTLVLRPKEETRGQDIMAALLFLQSEVAYRLVTAYDGRNLQLSQRALAQLEVPMPDASTADAMASIVDVRDSLRDWLNEADEVLRQLYVRSDAVAAKQEVLEVSRTLRARVGQGQALDDPGERYRTTYAYPVAVRWRMVEAAYSGTDPDKSLREILQAAEVTLAYAACVALVFAKKHGVELPCLKEVRSKLASGRSGMGFGDWANILNEATTSRAAQRVAPDACLSEVKQFFTAEGLGPARARLKQLRDGQSHGRSLAGQELLEAVEQSYADLVTMLEAAAPLSDLGLLYVDQARVDSLRGSTALRHREFRGDHPVVPQREALVDGTLFEEGSLYLRDTDNGWHLLRPYLLADPCPRCNAWSMFAIDRVVKSVPDYKSLDHGHSEERSDCLDALILVGLVDG